MDLGGTSLFVLNYDGTKEVTTSYHKHFDAGVTLYYGTAVMCLCLKKNIRFFLCSFNVIRAPLRGSKPKLAGCFAFKSEKDREKDGSETNGRTENGDEEMKRTRWSKGWRKG